MHLHNRWGTAVDPVPFFVVATTAFATCYSFGPTYLLTFDVGLGQSLAITTAVFAGAVATTYYRLVWTYRPAHREIVPVAVRFRRLLLGGFAALGVLALLALPFFVR